MTLPVDNRLASKPHFAAPPAPKPAPTILQPIHTGASAASSSSTTATRRARASLGPSGSRMPRASSVGLNGSSFQRFAMSGGRRLTGILDEGPSMSEFGVRGMTEKDIEEKVGNSSGIFLFLSGLSVCANTTMGPGFFLFFCVKILRFRNASWHLSSMDEWFAGPVCFSCQIDLSTFSLVCRDRLSFARYYRKSGQFYPQR